MSRLQAVIHNGQTADGDLYFSFFITCANKVVHRDENENRASSRAREKKNYTNHEVVSNLLNFHNLLELTIQRLFKYNFSIILSTAQNFPNHRPPVLFFQQS
jgi:hypothetical protein